MASRYKALIIAMIGAAILSPDHSTAVGRTFDDTATITLSTSEADIRDVLRMVARQSDVDIVVSKGVSGLITLDLSEASLKDTLDAIVRSGGLEYVIDGRIVTVSTLAELMEQRQKKAEFDASLVTSPPPPTPEALTIQLRYIDAERVMSVVEMLLSETGKASILKTSDHLMQEGVPNVPAERENEGGELQIGSRLTTTTQGQPARSHTLVVSDTPDRLREVEAVVAKIDVKPLQVLIEARFVEIRLTDDQKMGIDWNMVVRAAGGAAPHNFPFGTSSLGSFDPSVVGGAANGVFPNAPPTVSAPGGVAGLFTFGTLDFSALTAVLQMVQRDARAQVVSNPRIVVRDRNTATILVGERFPILSTTVSDQGTVTEELDHYEPIGVQLEVTPSVLNDREVELLVRPSTSTLGAFVEGSTGIQVARINTRQIDTSVTAETTETVVLGGLISTREVESVRTVPYLGDIPLIGPLLFTNTSSDIEKIDLVVFLTATILREPEMDGSDGRIFEATQFRNEEMGSPRPFRKSLQFSKAGPEY